MILLAFGYVYMFSYFQNNLVLKIKVHKKCQKGVSYDLNWTGFMGSLAYSLVKLWWY
jgi:hypothetical protein